MTLAGIEDREEMNSGLITFAVLSRGGIAWAWPLLLLRGLLLSSFLFALLLLGLAAFENIFTCTHFEFSFLLGLCLVQNPRNNNVGPVLN